MATPNPTSFSKTPQAKDDAYVWAEDQLLGSNQYKEGVITFDVMANDLGGNAKSLYSIADASLGAGAALTALLTADTGSAWERTAGGNWARIENGRVEFKLGDGLAAVGAANLNALSAAQAVHDEFVYAIRLGNGTLSQARVAIDIRGQNDGPVAVSDSATAVEAGGVDNALAGNNPVGNVLTNDTDVDAGDSKTVASVGNFSGAYGMLQLAADGSYTYVTNNAHTAVQALNVGSAPLRDTFSYTIVDAAGATSTAQLEVLIQGANDAAAINGTATGEVKEDMTLTASGTLQVTDIDSPENVRVQNEVAGDYGRFSVSADGKWVYTLDNASQKVQALNTTDVKTDSFTVTSEDGTASRVVTIQIVGLDDNRAPVAVNDIINRSTTLQPINENQAATIQVLANDTDADAGDILSIATVTAVSQLGANVTINSDGTLRYDPVSASAVQALHAGESITDTFTYTVKDNHGATSDTATVSVLVLGANDMATISGATVGAVTEDATLTSSGKLTVTDSDHDEAAFRALTNANGQYGKLSINASGEWTYVLNNNATQVQSLAQNQRVIDTFSVQSVDGTASKLISIDISGTNDAPTAVADTVAGATLTFEAGTYHIEYNDYNYYYYNQTVKTNDGYTFTSDGSNNLSVTSYWGADFSNAVYSYGYNYDSYGVATTAPVVMTKTDGSAFSIEAANITGYGYSYYNGYNSSLVETITGYYQGVEVAQKVTTVPESGDGVRNNVVTLDGDGWQQVDKVVFSLTKTNTFYDYYYYGAYQWIDNVVVNNTNQTALDITVLGNDFDIDQGGTLTIGSFSATSTHGAVITLNANGSFHYDAAASAELAALPEGTTVYDTFTYQAVDQYGASSNVTTVGITLVTTHDIA